MLDLHRLRILREIDQRGTITAAAQALYLTPPSVSHHMSALEAETGVVLLERVGRGVRLTPAARRLVEHTEDLLRHIEAAEADLALARDEVSGQFTLSTISTAAQAIVLPAVAALEREHPALQLRVLDMEQPEGLVELRSGNVDLVVGLEYNFTAAFEQPGLETELLLTEPIYVALPATHRLAETAVSLEELADELWIVPSAPNPCRQAVLRAAEFAGFEPRLRQLESSNYSVINAAVALGMGVTVLPHLALQTCGEGVRVHPLPDVPLRRRIFVAVRAGGSEHPAIAAIVSALKRTAEKVATEFPAQGV